METFQKKLEVVEERLEKRSKLEQSIPKPNEPLVLYRAHLKGQIQKLELSIQNNKEKKKEDS